MNRFVDKKMQSNDQCQSTSKQPAVNITTHAYSQLASRKDASSE